VSCRTGIATPAQAFAPQVDAARLEPRAAHLFGGVHRRYFVWRGNGPARHNAAPPLNTFTVVLSVFGARFPWLGYRRTRTAADFIVAGRTLGALVGGGTLAASQISAGTFVGTVGLHYMAGVCFAWVWPGAWLGWIVSAVFVAPKLRGSGALTVPDYFARRYGRRRGRSRRCSS
jgi:hypothetical protein